MTPKLFIDFTDTPNHTTLGQVNSTEQLAIMCGLTRRVSRRLGKTVSIILSNYPPETLIENSIRLNVNPAGHAIEFTFATSPIEMADAGLVATNRLGSLRRVGEKFRDFGITGSPDQGFEIRFSEPLPLDFDVPSRSTLKQWEGVIATGDWEKAFSSVSKIHNRDRAKIQELRDSNSIRIADLGAGKNQTDVILSLVASKADNPVLILDRSGRAEWANRSFGSLTGIALDDSELTMASDALFGAEKSESKQRFTASLEQGRTFCLEYSWTQDVEDSGTERGSANSPVWIEFQVTPVRDETNAIVRWIAIGANITRRRQAELAMQAAKEVAESANRAKSDFLAMMSHEIRTPMNAIIGMTELTLGTQLSIDQREYLTTANNSAKALLQILNDILDLSKVEAKRMELEQIDFNIADITRETLDTLSVLAQRKSLALRCEFPLDIHQQLVGDPTRLRQIIVNIVGNAIKFTSFGEVAVEVELLDETNDAVTLHYSVCDTGVGISAEKTSRIFEAFFQTDATVNRNFGGTGLGLAITSELIRLMGGRIWVESKLGKGTTFHFVLTFGKSARTFVALPSDAGQELRGKRILVVDDNNSNRLAIGRWMTTWGADCKFATTGREGENALADAASNFDLAILDVVLPDVDGFEVASKILESNRTATTPILMFSSDDRTSTISRCRELGIGCYLIKPVSPKTLYTSIRVALGANVSVDGSRLDEGQRHPLLERTNKVAKVLVVDDHASNRKLICEILRRRGHHWQEANNGIQAIEMIQNDDFDVVLMDVQMPRMDGLEATARIRQLDRTKSTIPIVAVTAYVTEDDRQRCLDATMDDYLPKPISVEELVAKVERWGNTTRDSLPADENNSLDNQLLIHDAPDWATQITRTIVVAEDSGASVAANSNGGHNGEVEHPFGMALARFGGDESLLGLQIGIFLQETPELMQELHKAINDGDGKAVHHFAHRLKGLVRTYDDELASELAAKLEGIGLNDEFDEAESTFVGLAEQVDNLSWRLRQLR